mgnify:CR=1 FL=1
MDTISSFTLVAGLVGGLAMFLYGMSVMSAALTKISGGKLESILGKVTANAFFAYLFGVIVTAVVESSSASTVMVVGLVNSGIMTLSQAVNVILGANLGTTFTAWLLSLNAISSENFFINLLKPTSFTPFLALVGIGLLMFSKSDKKKNIGTALLGFAVLMFGMDMMSDAVSPLKDVAGFRALLMTFRNPVIGLFVGIVFTMIIQSSAGTIGVVQALSKTVEISYATAIPVVIGAEVGTCITAILSSIGANKNGKRTALMHLYFNLIKAAAFMVIFYSLDAVFNYAFMDYQVGMAGIACIHTLVNLIATLVMLPFSGLLVKLVLKTIPVDEKELEEKAQEIAILDERFLSNPPFALELCRQALNDMASYVEDSLRKAMSLMVNYDEKVADEVAELENRIDRYEDQLGSYLVKINASELGVGESRLLTILLHSISDFERISDHAFNVMQVFHDMNEKKQHFSDKAIAELTVFSEAVTEIVRMAFGGFREQNLVLAREVEPLEEVIDGLHMEVKRRHVRRLRKGKCTVELGFPLSDIGTDYERIADHCSNIALNLLAANEDYFDTHEYIEMLKAEKNSDFQHEVEIYENKFRLPPLKKGAEEDEISSSFVQEHPYISSALLTPPEDKEEKKKKKKKKKKEKQEK